MPIRIGNAPVMNPSRFAVRLTRYRALGVSYLLRWAFRKVVTSHAREHDLSGPFRTLHTELHNRTSFSADHPDHLLITLADDGVPINRLNFLPLYQSGLASRPFRMNHSHI